jgi:hypothetical protein
VVLRGLTRKDWSRRVGSGQLEHTCTTDEREHSITYIDHRLPAAFNVYHIMYII